jgi:hypothetical protein
LTERAGAGEHESGSRGGTPRDGGSRPTEQQQQQQAEHGARATGTSAAFTAQSAYDERALPRPVASYEAYLIASADGASLGDGTPGTEADDRGAGAAGDGGGGGSGSYGDLPPPEPLSKSDETEAALLIEVLGELTAQCLYSKVWTLRQAALHRLREAAPTLTATHAPILAMRAAVQMLRKCAADRSAQVRACCPHPPPGNGRGRRARSMPRRHARPSAPAARPATLAARRSRRAPTLSRGRHLPTAALQPSAPPPSGRLIGLLLLLPAPAPCSPLVLPPHAAACAAPLGACFAWPRRCRCSCPRSS